MDESLKELLAAEQEAEKIVAQGEAQREQIVEKAIDDARALEHQFHARVPELHRSFHDKAGERAEQSVAEIKLRYDERNKELRALADQHSDEAVESALKLILPDSS